MKTKLLSLAAVMLLICQLGYAGSKTQEFKGSLEQVWTACVRAAADTFSLTFSDKDSHVLTFASGVGFRSWGMNASVSLRETDEGKIEVSVTPQKTKELWSGGAGGSVAKKFFKAVDKNLRDPHTVEPAVKEAKIEKPTN